MAHSVAQQVVKEREVSEKILAHQQPLDLQVALTPTEMVSNAMKQGATIEQLQAMIDFAERIQANEARMAFNTAFNAFKSETIRIVRDKENTQYSKPNRPAMYTSLENMVATVTPFLSKHGLSHHWDVKQDAAISVTCVITHTLGHSISVTMTGPADESGAKNKLQQIKSTTTYLKVSTFESVCGIASAFGSLDDDGNGASDSPSIPEEKLVGWLDSIDGFEDVESLTAFFKRVYKEAFDFGDIKACQQLVKRKDARKAAINEAA